MPWSITSTRTQEETSFWNQTQTFQKHSGKPNLLIERIYQDTKDWQGTPNRQDPTTKAMRNYLREISKDKHPESHTNAIINWNTIGAANGYRGKEWSQEKKNR